MPKVDRVSLREAFRVELFGGRTPSLFWLRAIVKIALGADGGSCVAHFRVASWLHQRGHERLGRFFIRRIFLRYNCTLHARLDIGLGLKFPHPSGIVIGKYVRIGERCRIYQGVTIGMAGGVEWTDGKFPVIGDDVTLWAGAKLFGPIAVGNRVEAAAGAVVTRDVPDDHMAIGMPARSRPRKDRV